MGSACHRQPQSGLCQDCSACVGSTGFRGTQDTRHWIGNEPCSNFPPFTEERSGSIFNNCVEKKQTTGKPYLRLDAAIHHSTLSQGQRTACPQDSHQNSLWSQEKPRLGPRSTCFAFRGNTGSPTVSSFHSQRTTRDSICSTEPHRWYMSGSRVPEVSEKAKDGQCKTDPDFNSETPITPFTEKQVPNYT